MSLAVSWNIFSHRLIAVSGKTLGRVTKGAQDSSLTSPNEVEIDDLWYRIYKREGR